MECLRKYKMDMISLILMIICSCLFGIIGVLISIVLLVTYLNSIEKNTTIHKIFLAICIVGYILFFGGLLSIETMTNTGIDGIGEALIYGFMISLGRIFLVISPIIMLIIDNRKYIFSKKVIITICSLIAVIFTGFSIKYLIETEKVGQNIPTVYDFGEALKERGFDIENADYRLYGISSKEKKGISLNFEENKDYKYPLYVYAEINYSWLIYYVNGEIYAVYGVYWDYYTAYDRQDGYNEEKIIWKYPTKIISETDEISVYNVETNRYEKGDTIVDSSFNYYSKNESVENSIFIDIPSIESWGTKITKKDKIHKDTLN